jgi:hypothetical protein
MHAEDLRHGSFDVLHILCFGFRRAAGLKQSADAQRDELVKLAHENSPMVDALSFPLTIIKAMHALKIVPPTEPGTIFNVVVIGASEKAEQRVAQVLLEEAYTHTERDKGLMYPMNGYRSIPLRLDI